LGENIKWEQQRGENLKEKGRKGKAKGRKCDKKENGK
jgi:hypothetical protein